MFAVHGDVINAVQYASVKSLSFQSVKERENRYYYFISSGRTMYSMVTLVMVLVCNHKALSVFVK